LFLGVILSGTMATTDYGDILADTAVVILAAGKGTRMGRADLAKVCLEIDGAPAISRVIGAFEEEGFGRFVVVIGFAGEQVIEAVGREHRGVTLVRQEPQLGTGHAARVAAEALEESGHAGYVLVSMGDKFIEAGAIEALLGGFAERDADMALVTIPKTKATEASGGRVFVDDAGRAVDIIEKADLGRQAIVDELHGRLAEAGRIDNAEIIEIIDRHISDPKKQGVAVAELLELAGKEGQTEKRELDEILQSARYNVEIDGRRYTAERIEQSCKGINPSLYLFKARAFYEGVAMIDNENAQAEYYLTDIVRHLAAVKGAAGKSEFKIAPVPIDDPDWIQGFNSPDELLAIQDYLRRRKITEEESIGLSDGPLLKAERYCTVSQWISKIESRTPGLRRWLEGIYGRHEDLHEDKCTDLIKVLRCYGERFGFEEKVCIVRAPGRINLMGRHVDHRGGWNNPLAINRETIAVAGIRADDGAEAVNVQPDRFAPVSFNISRLMGRLAWSDWIDFVNSDWVRNMLRTTAGDWGGSAAAPQ